MSHHGKEDFDKILQKLFGTYSPDGLRMWTENRVTEGHLTRALLEKSLMDVAGLRHLRVAGKKPTMKREKKSRG